jgi:hypothetical protein
MKALSIRPPWGYMVIYGVPYGIEVKNPDGSSSVKDSGKVILKNIENRGWALPKDFTLPQRIYIHISTRPVLIEEALDFCVGKLGLPIFPIMLMYSTFAPRGVIIGEVTITGQVTESENPWFTGKYGFVLADPKPYEKPIPYKGKLGFFEPDIKEMETSQ